MAVLDDDYLPPMTEAELLANRRLAWHGGLEGDFAFYGEQLDRADHIGHLAGHLLAAGGPEAPYLERLAERVGRRLTGADEQLRFLRGDDADGPALLADLERRFAEGC